MDLSTVGVALLRAIPLGSHPLVNPVLRPGISL